MKDIPNFHHLFGSLAISWIVCAWSLAHLLKNIGAHAVSADFIAFENPEDAFSSRYTVFPHTDTGTILPEEGFVLLGLAPSGFNPF